MSSFSQIAELFDHARFLAPVERRRFLDHHCTRPDLRAELDTLLAHHDSSGVLDTPLVLSGHSRPHDSSGPVEFAIAPGAEIGPFRIVRILGKGGFGTVCLAQQSHPVQRPVALKILRDNLASPEILARFHAEKNALARMDHPCIAKLFEASATPSGIPFLVMEYVPGTPITSFCDDRSLDLNCRLNLFLKVCDAVHHAHQKGILHRDLKPDNILVLDGDDAPTPRIIDFGIAKILDTDDAAGPGHTRDGQFLGTPVYMSPEQAAGDPKRIDIRSDVYGLGVVLYELLVGSTPHAPIDGLPIGVLELLDRVRRDDALPPSRRLADSPRAAHVAALRRAGLRQLLLTLRRELDWVVLKSIEKDPARRYPSVSELRADVERFLREEPLAARPDSLAYRLRKLVRKRRAPFAFAAGMLLLLISGVVVSASFALRADRQAAEARLQRDNALLIADYLSKLLDGVRASVAMGRDTVMLREMLDAASARLEHGELMNAPEAELRLRWAIGTAYADISENGAAQRAELILSPAVSLAQRTWGARSEQSARSLALLGVCLGNLGRPVDALPLIESALELRQSLFHSDHLDVAQSLIDRACCLRSLGRLDDALRSARDALSIRRRLLPQDHHDLALAWLCVADCLRDLNQPADALKHYDAALAILQRLYNDAHPDVALSLNNCAACLRALNRPAEALQMCENALRIHRRIFTADHPQLAVSLNGVAISLRSLDRGAEALPFYKQALEMRTRIFQGDHPDVAESLNNVAACLRALHRADEALPLFQAALEMYQRVFGHDHPLIATSLNNVAVCLTSLNRNADALPDFQAALQMRRRLFPDDHPDVAASLNNVAYCFRYLDRHADALVHFESALAMYRRLFPGDHPEVAKSLNNVACSLAALRRFDEAIPFFQESLLVFRRALPLGHPDSLYPQLELAASLIAIHRFSNAEDLLLDAARVCQSFDTCRSTHWPAILHLFVRLYDAWSPTQGDEQSAARAAEWRARLSDWMASTQPTTSTSIHDAASTSTLNTTSHDPYCPP